MRILQAFDTLNKDISSLWARIYRSDSRRQTPRQSGGNEWCSSDLLENDSVRENEAVIVGVEMRSRDLFPDAKHDGAAIRGFTAELDLADH